MKHKPPQSDVHSEMDEQFRMLQKDARQTVAPGKPSSGPRRPAGAPYWIPDAAGWDVLPSGIKQAVVESRVRWTTDWSPTAAAERPRRLMPACASALSRLI
jgi:hypothetical protein